MISNIIFFAVLCGGIALSALILLFCHSCKCEYINCCCMTITRTLKEEPLLKNISSEV
jgi:hypothetical protein